MEKNIFDTIDSLKIEITFFTILFDVDNVILVIVLDPLFDLFLLNVK